MGQFRKKPVVIEAVQFTSIEGDEIIIDGAGEKADWPEWFANGVANGLIRVHPVWSDSRLQVCTLEDDPSAPEKNMIADAGDWIICGTQGELYPCKPDIFEEVYEAA